MTPEDISRAGGKFQRLSSKPTAAESSTGLGLAIVKAIVDAHDGRLSIESEGKDKGATFTISLPDIPLPGPSGDTRSKVSDAQI